MESSMGIHGCSRMAAMLPSSSPGSTLGNPAGVIKPGRAVLTVLFRVVQAWGLGKAQLLTSLKEQGIHSSHFLLGVTTANGLLQVC